MTEENKVDPSCDLLLIDVSHLFRAAWHASGDQEVGAAYEETMKKIRYVLGSVPHKYRAYCIDRPPYWRLDVNPDYKGDRAHPSQMMVGQFQRIKDQLKADGEVLWGVKGFEADDVIAAACQWATEQGMSATIASNDKDMLQCVRTSNSANVLYYSTLSGNTLDANGVLLKFGVPPHQVPDMLALAGDTSDKVLGIPGIAFKTASKLIAEYGSGHNVVLAAQDQESKLTPKLRENLLTYADRYGQALVQVKLNRPVPGLDFEEIYKERKPAPSAEWDEMTEEAETIEAEAVAAPEVKTEPARDAEPAPLVTVNPVAIERASAPSWENALEPRSRDEAARTAKTLFESRLYPDIANPQAAFALISRGRTLGIDAATSLASIHMIKGRPSLSADLIVALVLRSGLADYLECKESSSKGATYITKRKGRPETSETFTVADATVAGLIKSGGNWEKYPERMCRHRAAAAIARRVYPDVVLGLYTPDELTDGVRL